MYEMQLTALFGVDRLHLVKGECAGLQCVVLFVFFLLQALLFRLIA